MYLQRKNQHCIFILSVLFCSKTETRYTLCTGGPSLLAKSGLAETFENSVLKSAKIHRRRKKLQAKFWQKTKTAFWGHEYFLLFK
jgi:hypothetical protein